jgi:hypothetical protein
LLGASDRNAAANRNSKDLVEISQRAAADFLNLELGLASTFAQMALNSFAAGHTDKAMRTAAAREAHSTIRKFLPKLMVPQRKPIEAKLETLDPLIEQLAAIK